MSYQKTKGRKYVVKAIKYLSWTVDSHFVESYFWLWVNKFFQTVFDQRTEPRSKFGTQKWDNPDFGLFFYAIAPAFKPFPRFTFFIEMGHQKPKNRKTGCKAIKCIYSEPWILILSGVPFDFYLINLFQTVLGQRTTISSLPPKKGWRNRSHPRFFQYSCGLLELFRAIF